MIKKISFKTKFGWITSYETEGKIFKVSFGKLTRQKKSFILENFKKSLLNFFNKKIVKIKAPHTIKGNETQKKVWNEMKKIEIGKTKSYGEIAKKYNLSPRHVGKICSQNKLLFLVPCHRVIRSDGTLGGFTSLGGTKLKKKILDFEKSI